MVFRKMWLSLVSCKKAKEQFEDISKEERLFNIETEGFLWPTTSWRK